MAQNVMAGLMPDDESQLIGIPRLADQRQREADDRPPGRIDGLIGIGLEPGAIIDDELEIAIDRLGAALDLRLI